MSSTGDDEHGGAGADTSSGAEQTLDTDHGSVPDLGAWTHDADRYELGDEIARGGGGRVVNARDRRLGREVAVKLPIGEPGSFERLVREAMVVSRLEHPSIVSVHDLARAADGTPFYVMKLLEGETLRARIAGRPFEERIALLPTLIAVADAIAYAHHRGFVHRDLKPHNVIVGPFGETAVIDWGLGRAIGTPATGAPGGGEPAMAPASAVAAELTKTGAVVGTPPYMAPEQARGEAVDARTDVYGLGALVYHVLCGEPPYRGDDATDVIEQLLREPPPPLAEREPRVPRDLAAIVGKAMARRAADRYPDARELASDLRRYQAGRLVAAHRYTRRQRARRWLGRHRVILGASAVAALSAAVALAVVVRTPDTPAPGAQCPRASEHIASAWNPARAAAVRAGFAALRAGGVGDAVVAALDRNARELAGARVEACEATHVRGEQSGVVLDARMRCLDGRLAQLDATAALLARPDAALADAAPRAVRALADLAECRDAASLVATPPPPADPARRAAFDALAGRIATQRAAVYLRADPGMLADARQLVADAGRLDHCLLTVQARLIAGTAAGSNAPDGKQLAAAAADLRALVRDADRCGSDRDRARALGQLLETIGKLDPAAVPDLDALAAELRAVAGRLGDRAVDAGAAHALAGIARKRGDLDGAIALAEEAIRLAAAGGDVDPSYRITLAAAYLDKGKLDPALEGARAVVAELRANRGADHPSVALALQQLAYIHSRRGEDRESIASLTEALGVLEGRFGGDHRSVVIARANLGGALLGARRHAEARPILEAALAAARRVTGPEHPLTTSVMTNLGNTQSMLDDYTGAERTFRELLAIRLRALGPDHPQTARGHGGLARALQLQRRYPEALVEARRAVAIQRAKLDPNSPELAENRLILGALLVSTGKPADAIAPLEQALAAARPTADRNGAAEAEFRLGTALWDANRERARARAMIEAVAARDGLDAALRKRAADWLAEHPGPPGASNSP